MDLNEAFNVGNLLQYIRRANLIKPNVKGDRLLLEALKWLESSVKQNDLDHDLQPQISGWVKKLEKKYGEDQKITDDDAIKLSRDASRWRDLLPRLLMERRVLELTRTGALNQKALLDISIGKPSAFFDERTWNALSDIEKSDFSDTARCLLSGIPTPAAMVALRGAEATVKKYYEFKIGEPAKKKVWGKIVKELESTAEKSGVRGTFLGYLDYIRDAKRNFTEHPNKIFSQKEAELIFMQVLNLVQDTYEEILQSSQP